MRKQFHIALAVLLVAVAGVIAWQLLRRPEPVYAGKPVSYWIARSGEHYVGSDFGRIGGFPRRADSNAIPYLVKALNRQENVLSRPYFKLWSELPSQVRDRLPLPVDAEQMRYSTAMSLGNMGAVGEAAIPALICAMREDTSERVRGWSASSLGQLGNQEGTVIGALTEALEDKAPFVRSRAAEALALSGPAARSAGASLVKCLDDQDLHVRVSPGIALKAIDSEAALKAGVK